jgi:hypothetical protein
MNQVREYKVGDPVEIDGDNGVVVDIQSDAKDGALYEISRVVDGFFILVPFFEMPNA